MDKENWSSIVLIYGIVNKKAILKKRKDSWKFKKYDGKNKKSQWKEWIIKSGKFSLR